MASVIRIEQFDQRGGGRSDHRARDRLRSEPQRLVQPRSDAENARSLNQLIEREIIPRLLVAHAAAPPMLTAVATGAAVTPAEVAAFAPLAVQVEADELLDHVAAIVARGVALETVLVDLLAPAARLLGQFWEDDRCDFVDVTMGLWRLQEVVHELCGHLPKASLGGGPVRRALFASLAGDQHSFGTIVIDELFGANGWSTDRLREASTVDLLARVGDDWFDLAGLTITCDCHIAPLPSIVRALRAASRNPRMCVMVGGRVFARNADLAATVGADGTAPDARVALRVAGELVDAVAREAVAPLTG
uniref:cobalamin B12-binding domain-containing protein n=1 Tax=uncultured Sphingomonas sp. TaxID=158754 RepID=UPI0035CB4B4F